MHRRAQVAQHKIQIEIRDNTHRPRL